SLVLGSSGCTEKSGMPDTSELKTSIRKIALVSLKSLGVLLALYFFLFGLDLMSGSFGALGGKSAGQLFTLINNPIAGLMVGILATVLVQSSSSSTSIVVGLVGAEMLTVHQAIPIIMGANCGTSVTNTIVSMAHAGDRLELERAFSGATVHDMFNMLTVLTLLPLEVIFGALCGEGPLYWLSKLVTEAVVGGDLESDLTFTSPTKAIVSPLTKLFLSEDQNVVEALSFGPPVEHREANCSGHCTYFCVSGAMSEAWRKVAEDGYNTLPACSFISECRSDSFCSRDAGDFYKSEIEGAAIIGKGFLRGAGDVAGGILGLMISLLVMCGALFFMVKLLHSLVMGHAREILMKGTQLNDYLAMLLGLALTFIVQSSSVVTSALTPLVGIGVLPVAKMLPMTLGSNIGTTFTSMLAALSVMTAASIQIAFCHLFFNILGILIWFPAPPMRRVVITAACTLGFYASYWRLVPLIYILVMFLALPGVVLGISLLFEVSVVLGTAVLICTLLALAALVVWWNRIGCYKVVSQEERELRKAHLAEAEV
ncbi:unnamed protein product, partial [Effrenium voratum]